MSKTVESDQDVRRVLREEGLIERRESPVSDDENEKLETLLAKSSEANRDDVDRFFDWVHRTVQITGLGIHDDRFATTHKGGGLRVQINTRIVFGWYPDYKGYGPCAGAILPSDSPGIEELEGEAAYTSKYSVPSEEGNPQYYMLPVSARGFFIDEYEADWAYALLKQKARGSSVHRAKELPAVYHAAVDREYRESVLNSVFEE